MAIAQGVSLGPYEILNQIGEGGMGEVWRARDQRIGRDVAVKVLPEFARGDERVWRFEQEARAAGALNHPNLVTIFDVGQTEDGAPYIVMELLEGETLREVIGDPTPSPMPLRKVIDYASQIASALAVTHEKGIIHRDLKPENLFVTTDGRVKILDFGLAKLAQEASNGDTRRTGKHLTSAGIAVGTPGYMSPEQVRAQTIDHRTDIFSFGSVVYEMVTGQPAFDCFSAVETMHAVLNAEPKPLSLIVPNTPPGFEAIVQHCLEKNPRDRFQSARDLAFQLRTLLPEGGGNMTGSSTRVMPAVLKRRPSRATIAVTALVLALIAGGFALYRLRSDTPAPSVRALKQLTFADGLEVFPTLSPDGKTVAYVSSQSGNRDIYVQRTDGREATNITSDSPGDDSEPAFSPDGSQIAFRSEREGRPGIWVMGVSGESPRRLTDFGHNPSWSPDGKRIVIATQGVELRPHVRGSISELWIIDARTGARKPLIQARVGGPDFGRESDAVQPSWSPNGKRIAFWGLSTWFAQRDLWTIDPDAPQPKQTVTRVTSTPDLDWNPVWSADGKYLYYGSDKDRTLNLWRVPMDEESGQPTGEPELMSLPASISGNFAFSRQGDLAYVSVMRSYHLIALPFDASSGAITGPGRMQFGGSQEILTIRLSPDGQSIAYTTGGSAQEDLFIADIAGTRVRQLTNDPARDRSPVWSHDGKTLFFYSNRDGAYRIWSIRADGSGLTRITDDNDVNRVGARTVYSPSVSPDGRVVAVQTDRSTALVHLDRPSGRRIEALPVMLAEPKWSPDGQALVGTDVTRIPTGVRGGIVVFSLRDRRSDRIVELGNVPQWLGAGRKVVFFESQSIGTFDLDTRKMTIAPVPPMYGAKYDFTTLPRVSPDGSTIYLVHTVEEGDVWMVRFPPAG